MGVYYEEYHAPEPNGRGFSASTREQVIRGFRDLILRELLPLTQEAVAALALRRERVQARQTAIAGVDVAAIAHGGVRLVETAPGRAVDHRVVHASTSWISEHIAWGYDPSGPRHRSDRNLEPLYQNPRAAEYVGQITGITDMARSAIQEQRISELAAAVTEYRQVFFERWSAGALSDPDSTRLAALLRSAIRGPFAYNFPGSGGVRALIVICRNAAAAVELMRAQGWIATQARIAPGLSIEGRSDASEFVTIRAPLRLDITAAADLGADPRIGTAGRCLAMAIHPLAELRNKLSEMAPMKDADLRCPESNRRL